MRKLLEMLRRRLLRRKPTSGFTFVEILIASGLLVAALVFTMGLFTKSVFLTQECGVLTQAEYAAESQMENLLTQGFTAVYNTYTNAGAAQETPFAANGEDINLNGTLDAGEDLNNNGVLDSYFDGSGTIYAADIGTISGELLRVKVVVCYRNKGRIIGEDDGSGGGTALNGILDGGEDSNGNGELDSPCQTETTIANY